MSRRTTVPAVASLALALAGCGGGDTPSAAPTSPSTPTTSATPSETTTSSPAPGDPYLAVPDGVTLDEPGSDFALKEQATAAWAPRQDLVGVVDVAVQRIEQTTVEQALAGFELAGSAKRSTPYFVTARAVNVGDTDLGARQLPLYVTDSTGELVAPTGIARNFEACPGSTLPSIFAPDDKTRSCLIFLVPEGATLESVMFRPPEGVVPLTWTGKIVTPKPDRKPDKKPDEKGER